MAGFGGDARGDEAAVADPGIPVLAADATPEEKDAHWFNHVYRGDRMPQLTWRAVLMGGILGMAMAASNLYTTLAIGWAFGVAITACVMSFVIWNGLRSLTGGALSQMSILENNCMQSTASAAGYSTGSTIATMFGALLLLAPVPEGKTAADVTSWGVTHWAIVAAFTLCTGLLGVFLAIPLKRQMINHEQLRFPSGTASAEMLKSLYSQSKDAMTKAYVLISGIVAGLLVGFFNTDDGTAEKVGFIKRLFDWSGEKFFRLQIPGEVPEGGFGTVAGKVPQAYVFEPSLLLIGAGIITGMRVCLSMFAGSLLLFLVVGPWLVQQDIAHAGTGWSMVDGKPVFDAATATPGVVRNIDLNGAGTQLKFVTWALWGGTAVMVFASLTSLALQWRTVGRAFTNFLGSRTGNMGDASSAERQLAAVEVPTSWMVAGLIPIGLALLAVQMVAFHISWWAGLIAIGMSFFLSLVACRATGETDTTPIGAMGKVMQLMFAAFHPGQIVPNLASAGVAANSAIGSADLLTDLKSGYLLGANPRRQFLAQFYGVFFGTLAIVPIWFLMVPNKAELEKFAAPSTRQWEAVAKVLTKGIDQLPVSAQYAILIGALVGVVLPTIEKLTPASMRKYVPSAMGLGLSWVIPYSSSLGFMVGALVGWVWELLHRKSSDKFSIGAACGVIAGESLMKAVLAMLATAIFLMTPKAEGTAAAQPDAIGPASVMAAAGPAVPEAGTAPARIGAP
ncbi:MAG: OPT/YSL family transporter [Phycisphaerae bacterium]|nr:OPT/YSL family transporter [Phycisphaerae bacterium]